MRNTGDTLFPAQALTLGLSAGAWLAIAILVLGSDPDPREQRLFAAFLVLAVGGPASIMLMAIARRRSTPLVDAFRALRRGMLIGLAAAGAAVLQFNSALTLVNLAFVLLVLLIVEMVFLARRRETV